MDWQFLLKAILLGIVQGLTEFLPVSSSGHLAIGEHILQMHGPGVVLEVAFHMGTLLAVFIYFRRDIASLSRSFFMWLSEKVGNAPILNDAGFATYRRDLRMITGIILGSIPTGLIGVFGKDWFESLFDDIGYVGFFLLVTAALLTAGEFLNRRYRAMGTGLDESPGWRRSLVIGLFQGIAIAPGISRSGSTVSAALALRMDPVAAARFSFLLGIPAMLGAAVLSIPDVEAVPLEHIAGYLFGALVSAVVGYLAIATFLGAIKRGKILWFAIYCLVLGMVVIFHSFALGN